GASSRWRERRRNSSPLPASGGANSPRWSSSWATRSSDARRRSTASRRSSGGRAGARHPIRSQRPSDAPQGPASGGESTEVHLDQRLLLMHQIMLGDRTRLDAYERAMAQVIQPGQVVVDVGAGTLILSLIALRRQPRHVYAIEADPQMAA